MAGDSLFSRSNQESGGTDDEGVRILDPDAAAEAAQRGETASRKGEDQPKYGDRPPAPEGPRPTLRFPLAGPDSPPVVERPRVAPVTPRSGDERADEEQPMITVEPATGETELPHWTEPATGEVPRVIIGEPTEDEDLAEQERWSSFAASGPRWRDEHEAWEQDDVAADLAEGLADEPSGGLGALDTTERPTHEEFLTFEDLQVPEAPAPTVTPSVPAQAGPDPIRIQTGPVAAPAAEAGERRGEPAPARPRARRPSGGEGEPASSGAGRDVPQAVFVGVAIAAVAVILMSLGPPWIMILVEIVIVLAGIELFSALRQGGYRPATLLGLAAVAAFPLAVYWRGEPAMPLVLFLTVVFTLLWFVLGVSGNVRSLPNAGITVLVVAYVGLLGSFAAMLLKIPGEGVSIFLVTVVAGVFYDVGGFFVGRRFGRRPLTSVSPNKTLEGLVGGMLAAVVATVVVASLLGFGPFSLGQALAFGVALAIAAPLGDLAESMVKRDLGLKDMGALLPGHGGILDRFDGMLFVLPTAYYTARLLELF